MSEVVLVDTEDVQIIRWPRLHRQFVTIVLPHVAIFARLDTGQTLTMRRDVTRPAPPPEESRG